MASKVMDFVTILLFVLVKLLLAALAGMGVLVVVKHYLVPDICRLCAVAVFSFGFGIVFGWLRGFVTPKL